PAAPGAAGLGVAAGFRGKREAPGPVSVMRVRLWLLGVICLTCGIISRVVFELWARPGSRLEAFEQACFQAAWFGTGLFLLLVPLLRRSYAPGCPTRGELTGCALWVLGAVAALFAVLSSLGPRPAELPAGLPGGVGRMVSFAKGALPRSAAKLR